MPAASVAGPASLGVRRRPIWSGWSSGLVSGLVGNFDDNTKAPALVLSGLETVCRAIGLRQPVANVRQSDAGRRAGGNLRALAVAVVGHLDAYRLALARRGDPDVGAVLGRSHGIFDRILDQRLEQKRGEPRADRLGLDAEMRPQAVLEAHFLDFQIKLQRFDFLRERNLAGGLINQRVTQE